MKVFSIQPKIIQPNGKCLRVDSYLKKAVKLGTTVIIQGRKTE